MIPIGTATIGKMPHITLFSQDLQEIQQIGLQTATEATVNDSAALRFGQRRGTEQPDKLRSLSKTLFQHRKLGQNTVRYMLFLAQAV
jgi:hypothetical protein